MADTEDSTSPSASPPGALVPDEQFARQLAQFEGVARLGRITGVAGQVIRAVVPDARLGEVLEIKRRHHSAVTAEVVGFDRHEVVLMPLSDMTGLSADAEVRPTGSITTFPAGAAVKGRVLNAMGEPMDKLPPLNGAQHVPLMSPAPHPLLRKPIDTALVTGIKAIDGMLTVGRGQRVGIFAEAGGGKSTLLGMIARFAKVTRVVVALIGERGREVEPFIRTDLGAVGMANCTVVVSTSDQPALLRLRAAYGATAIAEEARAAGEHVVLMIDSVTRFARALRDAGLAAGEAPGRQGYPASMAQILPRLFERAGNSEHEGSITAFYTVLVEGGDMQEPVAHETRSLLDGHLVLSEKINDYRPRIDIENSKSRVRDDVITKEHRIAADEVERLMKTYNQNYTVITTELYKRGGNPQIDRATDRIDSIYKYLDQDKNGGAVPFSKTVSELQALAR